MVAREDDLSATPNRQLLYSVGYAGKDNGHRDGLAEGEQPSIRESQILAHPNLLYPEVGGGGGQYTYQSPLEKTEFIF